MNENTIGFAFLLLVAAASVFSLLFTHGSALTGQAQYEYPKVISDEVPPYGFECEQIRCPYGYPAEAVLDRWGRPSRNKVGSYGPGNVLCECPVIPADPGETFRLRVP